MQNNYIVTEDFIVECGTERIDKYFYEKMSKFKVTKGINLESHFVLDGDCYVYPWNGYDDLPKKEKIKSPRLIDTKYLKYFELEVKYKLNILLNWT